MVFHKAFIIEYLRKLEFVPAILLLVFLAAVAGCSEAAEVSIEPTTAPTVTETDQTPPCRISEELEVPFSRGINAVTTHDVYSGPVQLTVHGIGQAMGSSSTDAFYVFTDGEGNAIPTAHPEEFILSINGELAHHFIPDQTIPPYNPKHGYTFDISAPGGVLTFGVMDGYTSDNAGSYTVSICRYGQPGTEVVQSTTITPTIMATEIPPTGSPSPVPPVPLTPPARILPTPAFSPGDPVTLTSIQMVSAREGWGISRESLLITRDGGRSWKEVRLPPIPATNADFGVKIYFEAVDASHAWMIYGPKPFQAVYGCIGYQEPVWYTTDAGLTWNASNPLYHGLSNMDCEASFLMANTQQGWMSIDGWYVAAGPKQETQFFQTENGGGTWLPVTATWCWSEYDTECSSQTPGWLSDRDFYGQAGWMLENLSGCTPCYGNVPSPAYFISADGGENWDRRYLPPPGGDSDFFNDYFFCEPYDLNLVTEKVVRLKLACSQYEPEAKPAAADYLYASEDGGLSWETVKLPVFSEEMNTQLKFFDPDYGLLLGRELWRTTDGGQTWQQNHSLNWDGQFSFIDRYRAWAVASSGDGSALVFTEDGGKSWQLLHPRIAP
jgi:photosystem II stability/assembly factor-like uncharacterized protein